jgi:peptidoglycan hydrolase CwlO-like protein
LKLTRRHAQLFLDAKHWALKLVEDELRDLQKEIQEFETKKTKLQSEIKVLESIICRRDKENAVFQNLKPFKEKP